MAGGDFLLCAVSVSFVTKFIITITVLCEKYSSPTVCNCIVPSTRMKEIAARRTLHVSSTEEPAAQLVPMAEAFVIATGGCGFGELYCTSVT